MGHLLLARHASTHASKNHRNLGQKDDAPLAWYGRKVAGRLGVAVQAELGELAASDLRLVSSPTRRARQTMAAIASNLQNAPQVEVEGRLIEIDYGAWEGLKPEECARRDPELRTAWEADPYATHCPGGESGADVAERAFPVFESLVGWLSADDARAAIVVAHNHVNRLWLTALMGWPMADYRRRLAQETAAYSLITYAQGPPLVRRINARPLD